MEPILIELNFFQSISNFIFKDCLDLANFKISNVKFEMKILHWIVVKVLFRKPYNWVRINDHDLYLMWVLWKLNQCSWIKFIFNNIKYWRTSPKRSLFFSSFIQFILDLNGISSADAALVEAPKLVDSTVIKMMRYFKDEKEVYYYLDNVGRYVYEDMIEISKGLEIK